MNRETYEEIKKQIQANFHQEMEHLEALAPRFGVFDSKTPLKTRQTGLALSRKPEMKVLKEIPTNGVSMPIKGYIGKLVPCEVKDCKINTQPARKCPSCTKIVCTRHLRGKVCKECNEMGEQ
jgi:hypothetical protein